MSAYKKKRKDSEENEEDYTLPADAYYDKPNKSLMGQKRYQQARGDLSQGGTKKNRREDFLEDDQIEKML